MLCHAARGGQGASRGLCYGGRSAQPQLNITMKGVSVGRRDKPAIALCNPWPDVWSPSCPNVQQSMIPALALKTYQLRGAMATLESNVRTAVQGRGVKTYTWTWWWQPLRTKLKRWNLLQSTHTHNVRTWYVQGKAWAG